MPLVDYIKDRRNRIIIGSVAGVGVIIATATAIFSNTGLPAYRVESALDNDRYWEVSDHGAMGFGTGASAFGAAGDCVKSGGGSGKMMSFGTCGSGGGGGTAFGSGQVVTIGDSRYVMLSGDTMTGALTVRVTGGNKSTLGAEVENLLSGAVIRAQDSLNSSGALVFEGAGSGASLTVSTAFDGAGLTSCSVAGTSKLLWTSATKRFSCGTDTDTDTNTTYTAGQGLTLSTTSFKVNATLTGSTIKFGTMSGNLVTAQTTLASSGSLVFEGDGSGARLVVSGQFSGVGLTDCDTALTSKLLWDTTTKRFSCGADTDTDTNTTYTAGQGLTLTSTSFKVNATLTGTTLKGWTTISGSLVTGNTLASSGSLIWEGTATGANMIVSGQFSGVGLTDCDVAGTSKLLWDTTTKRFSCGADTDTNTTYTAGQGLTLTSTSFKANATLTGTSLRFQTVSGSTLHADLQLASSGSLKVLGNMSGKLITVNGGTVSGNLLVKSNLSTHGTLSGNALQIAGAASVMWGSLVIGKSAINAADKLEVLGTISGSTLTANVISGAYLRSRYAVSPACPTVITGSGTSANKGSGKLVMFPIPKTYSGYKVSDVIASVITAGTTNGTSFQIRNLSKGSRKILSTVATIDSATTNSDLAATPRVITAANADVGGGDQLAIDITAVSTTAPKGIGVQICFKGPNG